MPIGDGGKYDAECNEMRIRLGASVVLLIVLEGKRGTGFSASGNIDLMAAVPSILRDTAGSIEKDLSPPKGSHH